jgi:glycosyltransferase involved in cell wall biosynthesis
MRVSIAMCTYNGAVYLPEQLESFARQTLVPHELVVCDDCSSDSTVSIVEDFARAAPFSVRIFRNEVKLGYVRNFEQAVRFCEGELIALSDQDDVWYPHKLAELSRILRSGSAGGVFSDGELMDSESQRVPGTLWEKFAFHGGERDRFRSGLGLEVLLRRNVATGMTIMFRAELRAMLLPVPAYWEHDAWIAMMLTLRSGLELHTARLVRYRVHPFQEIGVPASAPQKLGWIATEGLAAFLGRVRRRNVAEYALMVDKHEELSRYLLNREGETGDADTKRVLAKTAYAKTALIALSKSRLERLTMVLGQANNYRSFSPTGLRAMVRDLII